MPIFYQGYDESKSELYIAFDDGEMYTYFHVPKDVAEGMKYAAALGVNAGKFFTKYIKRYQSRRMK